MVSTLLTKVPASLVSGTKTGADVSDGAREPGLASPASYMNPFPVLHLVEDLRLALETLEHPQERAALLSQIPGATAAYIKEWFEESSVSRPMACLGPRHGVQGVPPLPGDVASSVHRPVFSCFQSSFSQPPQSGPSLEGRTQSDSLSSPSPS